MSSNSSPGPIGLRCGVSAGAAAGLLSALINGAYFAAHLIFSGSSFAEPSWLSVTLSSFFPSVLGGAGYALLSRFTRRARPLFVAITSAIVILSFESVFRDTLPDGSVKPPGFDLLVMPMHVVVGLVAILLVPRLSRSRAQQARGPILRSCAAE
jgi:hypothetical protein